MLDMVIGLPPIIHRATPTANDIVMAWVIIGLIVALVLVATIILVIAGNRSVQRQSQMKEAEQHYEAFPQPQGGEQPQVAAPEEEKILLPL